MQTITIKVGKIQVSLEFTFNTSTWSLYCPVQENFDFTGSAFNGHYNYNNKEVVMYMDAKEWKFFHDELKEKMERILRKAKVLNK